MVGTDQTAMLNVQL